MKVYEFSFGDYQKTGSHRKLLDLLSLNNLSSFSSPIFPNPQVEECFIDLSIGTELHKLAV